MKDDEALAAIRQRVVALVDEALSQNDVVFLSYVGIALGDQLAELKASTGLKLSEFISKELADRYRLVTTGEHNNIQCIIASDAASSTNLNLLRPMASKTKGPRYHPRFWAAFSVPATAAYRIINLETLTFFDTDEPELPIDSMRRKIPADLIPDAAAENRDDAIKSSINKWASQNAINDADFHLKKLPSESITGKARSLSLLELMGDTLTRSELARIQMPLEIAIKLARVRL